MTQRFTQPSANYTWMLQTCPARWQISTTTWLSSKQRSATSDFIKISTSIPLQLTTVEIVDPAKPSAVEIDSLRIHDHIPDPSKLSGHKPTKLLAALVRFQNAKYLM